MVDFMFLPYNFFQNITSFAVLPDTDLCSELNIHTNHGKPDHSLLCLNMLVNIACEVNSENENTINQKPHVLNDTTYLHHICNNMPEIFYAQ